MEFNAELNNEELSQLRKTFESCKFRLISFLGILLNTLAFSVQYMGPKIVKFIYLSKYFLWSNASGRFSFLFVMEAAPLKIC